MSPIKVLVVDDSPVAREFLTGLLNSDPQIRVVGTAADGMDAVAAVEKFQPDLVTMDIHMPRMDGQAAIREIMRLRPTPIVVVTGNEITEEVRATFASLELGALALVPRPHGIGHADHDEACRLLVQTVKLMAEVKVVRRWSPRSLARTTLSSASREAARRVARIVAIGASTGGPAVLKSILEALPRDFSVPVVIVQHIAPGFVEGFIHWLSETVARPVLIATPGMTLVPGTIYVAAEEAQLGFDFSERMLLEKRSTPHGLCPSVSHLFKSVARVFGPNAVGILLTGMGRDGADGLLLMRQAGALTIAQDKESSIVHGMPGEAIRLRAAELVLSPEKIAEVLGGLSPTEEGR